MSEDTTPLSDEEIGDYITEVLCGIVSSFGKKSITHVCVMR